MATPRTRNSRVFTISFPEDLAKQVEQIAQEESRNISELFREAFRAYRSERARYSLEKTRAEVHARRPQIHTEDEIEGFVKEVRAERAAERKMQTEKATV
jgi:metal-responsive CopG/Arc/MetJ family transcriptional regulator